MGTWTAFYVRASDDAEISAVRRELPKATIETSGGEFIGIRRPDGEGPDDTMLSGLSARLNTDVIWLSFQSVVDAFEFHHWRSGKALRSLVFGCFKEERTWERVEGTPEPWEREVFFNDESLEIPLEFAESAEEAQELRRIWKEAELLRGRTVPGLDSRSCAHEIARYYKFPHYGL